MASCSICTLQLKPRTLANLWYCERCNAEFAPCVSCAAIASRSERGMRSCQNRTCMLFDVPLSPCPACRAFSLRDPAEVESCQNANCVATGTVLHKPKIDAPARDDQPTVDVRPGRPLGTDLGMLEEFAEIFARRYQLEDCVFRGGMGEVWRATDYVLGRQIAIKLARADLGQDADVRQQFLKEARVAGRLLHPNVLPVFDLGIDGNRRIYFSMRFVDGASLRRNLEALQMASSTNLVAFPIIALIEVFLRGCQGIDFAHQQHVLHLDLKPDNVLVSGFSEVFVIDWGISQVDGEIEAVCRVPGAVTAVDSDTFATMRGENCVAGTPGYMAPEQARGESQNLSPATDVFGLGGILYYILYGSPPCWVHGARDVNEHLSATLEPQNRGKLRHGILPKGRRIKRELLEALDSLELVCLKTLERDPLNRYRRVEDLIIDLNEWLALARTKGLSSNQGGFW